MRLFNSLRNWSIRRTAEATTDDSLMSVTAGSVKQGQQRLLHRSRRDAAAAVAEASLNPQLKHSDRRGDDNDGDGDDDVDDGVLTNSCGDLFQTLMSNSVATGGQHQPNSSAASRRGGIKSGNNRNSQQFWHTDDPDFLPTAYPLTRTDPRCHRPAKWGSLNLAASAALLEEPLKRFNSVADKHPRFRLGPRTKGEDEDGKMSLGDRSSATSSRSRSALDLCTPKYAFIAQDGKLVEREVQHWPKKKEPKLTLRYKLSEPYATNYGKKSVRRARSLAMRPVLLRHRFIYERPIYLVPRAVVNDNKRRLLARHLLKDRFEACALYPLPMSVSMQEGEQCKRYLEYQAVKYTREAGERVAHTEKMKQKALTPESQV